MHNLEVNKDEKMMWFQWMTATFRGPAKAKVEVFLPAPRGL